ncbi:MAG: hypothetical protein A2X94_17635 [Bdellovibrionales bacterium GWB1_55_8]|nr:MAG: hypothetical protein A2X94_17635 [Bdellovibrionales bacterium GWB1_55_8]
MSPQLRNLIATFAGAGKGPSPEEWSRLFDEHASGVRAILYQMGAGADLDDLVQECWIKIWKGMGKFRGESAPKTWIRRIVANAMIDHYRKRGISPDSQEFDENAHSPEPVSTADSSMQNTEASNVIQTCLNTLSLEHRTVLILAVIEEHTIEEVASITSVSAGTVKSRLHHAKAKMKEALKRKGISHEF